MDKFSKTDIRYFFLKDENIVKKVYNETYRLLFHIAFSILSNKEDAEDMVSETYYKVLSYDFNKLKNSQKFVSFLTITCKNLCLDLLKKKQKEANLEINDNMLMSHDEETSLIGEIKKVLSKQEYDVFIYHAYFGLSYKEISPLINKNETRCRVIFSNARKILRQNKELFL